MLGGGIFSIFGTGLNAAINSGLADEQWGNQLRLMDIQNRYNEQMAKNNQQRNKDLWDYTNYENNIMGIVVCSTAGSQHYRHWCWHWGYRCRMAYCMLVVHCWHV